MKNCSVFATLISPSKMILFEKKYQTFDTVFHHQMKHLEVRQKYSAARCLMFDILHETLSLMLHILLELYKAPLTTGSKVSFHVFFSQKQTVHVCRG